MSEPQALVRLRKFRSYFEQKNDYQMFVGVPEQQPREWDQVFQLEGAVLFAANLRKYALSDVGSWVVASATTGEVVDGEGLFEPLPDGVVSITRHPTLVVPKFTWEDLSRGGAKVVIQFGASPTHPGKATHFSTALTNISKERIACV